MARPQMIVVAGPSGSGKTTVFPASAFGVEFFNVDDRCAQLVGSYRAIPPPVRQAVAVECEQFVLRHIEEGRSFAVETTLRTLVAVEQAKRARERGFVTFLRFIATDSVVENVERVLQRAQAGGHAASERNIRVIYEASLRNLAPALSAFEFALVYDSSERWVSPRLVATKAGGAVAPLPNPPVWLVRALGA